MSNFKSAQGGWMLCEEASDAIDALESEMLRLAVKGRDKIAALEAECERLRDKLIGVRQIARYEANPATDHLGVRQRIDEMITAHLDEMARSVTAVRKQVRGGR